MPKPTVPVTFRIDRNRDPSSLTAVLPTMGGSPSAPLCCYAHIGQHSTGSYGWYRTTRPATAREYQALLSELRGIYSDCQLRIVRRISHAAVARANAS